MEGDEENDEYQMLKTRSGCQYSKLSEKSEMVPENVNVKKQDIVTSIFFLKCEEHFGEDVNWNIVSSNCEHGIDFGMTII